MILETATVTSVEKDALWVEAVQNLPVKPVQRKKVVERPCFQSLQEGLVDCVF